MPSAGIAYPYVEVADFVVDESGPSHAPWLFAMPCGHAMCFASHWFSLLGSRAGCQCLCNPVGDHGNHV